MPEDIDKYISDEAVQAMNISQRYFDAQDGYDQDTAFDMLRAALPHIIPAVRAQAEAKAFRDAVEFRSSTAEDAIQRVRDLCADNTDSTGHQRLTVYIADVLADINREQA